MIHLINVSMLTVDGLGKATKPKNHLVARAHGSFLEKASQLYHEST